MTDPRCDRLDEYLCGWLSPDDAADFEAHLAVCAECQDEMAAQRQIDGVLAQAMARAEPVPAVLAGRIERGVRAMRRRRIGWACALTAAAAVFLALGIWKASSGLSPRDDDRPMAQTPVVPDRAAAPVVLPAPPEPQPVVAARVTLVDPSSAIVVPIESHSPNVTLVRIYPTTQADRQDAVEPSP